MMTYEEYLKEIEDFDEITKRELLADFPNYIPLHNPAIMEEMGYVMPSGKDPFEGLITDKTFYEISNEIGLSTPFGKDSVFYRELREIITGKIPKL